MFNCYKFQTVVRIKESFVDKSTAVLGSKLHITLSNTLCLPGVNGGWMHYLTWWSSTHSWHACIKIGKLKLTKTSVPPLWWHPLGIATVLMVMKPANEVIHIPCFLNPLWEKKKKNSLHNPLSFSHEMLCLNTFTAFVVKNTVFVTPEK